MNRLHHPLKKSRLRSKGSKPQVGAFDDHDSLKPPATDQALQAAEKWRGHLAGLGATLLATLLALALEAWLQSGNLVLLYVLAVAAVGLRFGAGPALSTALLSFLGFIFFFAEPRYTFTVGKQDDITTLLFLLVLALICGAAATQIRHRLQLLQKANQYSEAMRELEAARAKSEVEQLRSALLSSVSHDLRSPLAAMMGAADSLRVLDTQLDSDDRRELIDTILQESQRLDRYIQNLLDMTRLGHGTLKIERDWVSAADIIGSALTRLKRYFPGVQTEYRAPVESPLLYAHAALIEQALFNILENAARYSPPEERIVVSVETAGNRCRISVEDRGPGIPEPLREKIFDMFYVVADGDQKKHNTGMGLAICRGMIGAHGGSVQALPGSQGKGTRFVVELPIDPSRDSDNSQTEEPA